MITATRRLQYAIGHRVYGHEGKCADLHGHNFVFFLTARPKPTRIDVRTHSDAGPKFIRGEDRLDDIGRVIDFGVLKERFGAWFEENWDHGMVLFEQDREAVRACKGLGGKVYELPVNPTAENLARYVLLTVAPTLLEGTGVELVKVRVEETENGIAEAEWGGAE